MADELVVDRIPRPGAHGGAGGRGQATAQVRAVDQPAGGQAQLAHRVRRVQQPVVLGDHQVQRSAGGRGHDGYARGQRLLHGLAERLVGAGVHEDVQARVQPGQLRAGALPQEHRVRQHPAQPRPVGPVAHDHQPRPAQPRDVGEQADPLVPRQPPDVADQHLPARCEAPAQPLVAVARVEALAVHTALPQAEPGEVPLGQPVQRRGGGDQCPVHGGVDPAQVGPQRVARRDPVAGGEADQVGLEHRDGGQRPAPRDLHRRVPEERR
ncbi:hypothetical protein GCM10022205_22180 [Spinactinospora alkalitolerans]